MEEQQQSTIQTADADVPTVSAQQVGSDSEDLIQGSAQPVDVTSQVGQDQSVPTIAQNEQTNLDQDEKSNQSTDDSSQSISNQSNLPTSPSKLLSVQQPTTFSSGSTQGWMMDSMGRPAPAITPAAPMINGSITPALTLGYGSQSTSFYQVPTYSTYGVGFVYYNTWEGEPVDENVPPGKHGAMIVTAEHRQFHILATVTDPRVGQLHLLNVGDPEPGSAVKVVQNIIPNHYRICIQYIRKYFVCEFVDGKFAVQACEMNAPKFSGSTSTLAWTNAIQYYCPNRSTYRLSGPLYFGFAIQAVQDLCPNLKYQARKTGARHTHASSADRALKPAQPLNPSLTQPPTAVEDAEQSYSLPDTSLPPLPSTATIEEADGIDPHEPRRTA